MAAPRWKFEDLVELEEYEFEINPDRATVPTYQKNIQYQSTLAPGGKVLAYEGRDEPRQGNFSGILLTQQQRDALIEWFEKRRQIQLTDDNGEQTMIYITQLELQRQRSFHWPFKHEFTINYTIIDWV